MRITEGQAQSIKDIVASLIDPGVEVWLFGSRVDDYAKGGDIDILVVSKHDIDELVFVAAKISTQVSRLFHGRKTDVILQTPSVELSPIHTIAKETGIKL